MIPVPSSSHVGGTPCNRCLASLEKDRLSMMAWIRPTSASEKCFLSSVRTLSSCVSVFPYCRCYNVFPSIEFRRAQNNRILRYWGRVNVIRRHKLCLYLVVCYIVKLCHRYNQPVNKSRSKSLRSVTALQQYYTSYLVMYSKSRLSYCNFSLSHICKLFRLTLSICCQP